MHDLNGFALFGLSEAFGRRTDMGRTAQEVSHDLSQVERPICCLLALEQ